MKREVWVERILTGISAVVGVGFVIGIIYAGLAGLWLVMKAPDAFALVAAASIIGAAIYFRGPTKVYNMQMSHPETEEVLSAVAALLHKHSKK